MKLILSFLKKYDIAIYVAYSLTLIELVSELLFPFILGIMINNGIMNENMDEIIKWGMIMFGITIISFTAGMTNSYISAHISVSSAYDIRKKLFAAIQQFTFEQLSKYPTSALVTRFTNDVRQIQNTIFMGLRIMVRAPLMVIGSVIMAFIVNPKISIVFLITVPILIIFLFTVLNIGRKMFVRVQQNVDKVNLVIQENIAGMRVIKAFVRGKNENKRFSEANETLARNTEKAFRFMESSMPVLMFIMNISLVIILYVGHQQIQIGTTSVGDVVAIVNYALRTVMAISMFTFLTLAFARATSSAERIAPILEEKVDKPILKHDYTVKHGAITFDQVNFTYPNDTVNVLQHVSFHIKPGETVAILGSTGAGKTTLFQLIPKLYTPTSGEIFLDDQPLHMYDTTNLRTQIGYVPQSPLLFTGTIRDNISFGKADMSGTMLIKAAKDAQIHDTITSFQHGYDTVVGQKGVNLSGGQKQRISIARALLLQPKILMLDDATSALDTKTEHLLLDALRTYECTTLIITQKISTAKQADNILLLDQGKVVDFANHATLLERSAFYQRIVESQAEREISHE